MRSHRLRLVPLAWAACLLLACTGGDGGEEDGPLTPGHYLVSTDQDDNYAYSRFFVVTPGSTWEFVEYGVRGGAGMLCQVTRSRGRYGVTDSLIALTLAEEGERLEKCPMTQADFDGYTWEAAPPGTSQSYAFRNRTDSSFEAGGMFGSAGWRTYRRTADPHGFFD